MTRPAGGAGALDEGVGVAFEGVDPLTAGAAVPVDGIGAHGIGAADGAAAGEGPGSRSGPNGVSFGWAA